MCHEPLFIDAVGGQDIVKGLGPQVGPLIRAQPVKLTDVDRGHLAGKVASGSWEVFWPRDEPFGVCLCKHDSIKMVPPGM